jgi:hypothetical protein
VRPKRPPKKKGPCPLGGDHIPKGVGDVKNGIVTHDCACGFSWSRALGKPKPKGGKK